MRTAFKPFLLFLVLLLTLSVGQPAFAQPILNSNDELLNEARFMIGISGMDFIYSDFNLSTIDGQTSFTYQFNGDVYSAFIGSGKFTGLTIGYGNSTETFFLDQPENSFLPEDLLNEADVRFLNVKASLGGNSQVWENIMRQDLNLYIPIRLHLNYFNVFYDAGSELRETFNTNFQENFRPLNKLESSFNLGIGVNFRTDRFFPLLQDRLMADLHFTRGIGANVQYTDGDMYYGGARHDEVNASVHFLRVLGQTSVVTGFRHIQAWFNQDGFDDVLSMLTDAGTFESSHSSLMFFVGIKF